MVVTNSVTLPSEEELTVQEINISGAALKAGAFHFGKQCEYQSNEFMLCRKELQDPRKCLNEGKAVTGCVLDFYQKVKSSCFDEFTQYANCLNKSSGNFALEKCRKTQAVYDKCVTDNLGIERPPVDYFSKVRVHNTSRPKPEPPRPDVYPDATPRLPDDYPREPAKYGSRFHWLN
ncbi:NADH dehydrogenase [ubiquinone] 1 alpha subcomplex subunit 8 [Bacillus rossius redtenbacheri]|uniref:NADH dehydrogenase [ubiquinone] 1 alpha subcomplex subunit 8 n=1 Tax=Bacillus rossius redtenbacheri TaxID=93214 RepID=UPI002FDE9CA7